MVDFIFKTHLNDLVRYYIGKLLLSYKNKSSRSNIKSKIEIAGALHGLNVGDIALGKAIASLLEENDIKDYYFTNIYKIQHAPKADYLIVCGGATGSNENIKNIYNKYQECPKKVSFIGMDWEGEIHQLDEKIKSWLNQCHCISSRSKVWQEYIGQILSSNISKYHLDNVLSWLPNKTITPTISSKEKSLGINMMSFYMQLDKNKNFIPGHGRAPYLKENNTKQFDAIPKLGKWYVDIFKELIKKYKKQGYDIIHIPFAIEDDLFARTVLKECEIKFKPYKDLESTLSVLSNMEAMIATRYHALIFALSLKIPCKAFLYCNKSIDLYNELELSENSALSLFDLIEENYSKTEQFIISDSLIQLSSMALQRIADNTKKCINKNLRLKHWIS